MMVINRRFSLVAHVNKVEVDGKPFEFKLPLFRTDQIGSGVLSGVKGLYITIDDNFTRQPYLFVCDRVLRKFTGFAMSAANPAIAQFGNDNVAMFTALVESLNTREVEQDGRMVPYRDHPFATGSFHPDGVGQVYTYSDHS